MFQIIYPIFNNIKKIKQSKIKTRTPARRVRSMHFRKAREYSRSLGLKNRTGWLEHCTSGKKPNDIPTYPNEYYKDKGWISWGDWLGTNYIAPQKRKYRPFNEAR